MQTVTQGIVHYYLYLQFAQFRNLLQDFFVFPLVLSPVFRETNDKTLGKITDYKYTFPDEQTNMHAKNIKKFHYFH